MYGLFRDAKKTALRLTTRNVPVFLWLLSIVLAQRTVSNNTNCLGWGPGTKQYVTVAPDVGTLYLGPECNVVVQNISLTFSCYPNVTIHIAQWKMQGGYVAVVGPPEVPWSVRDIAVVVTSSSIWATMGPAVSILLGWNGGETLFSATNVSLAAYGSTLRSTSSTMASTLGCINVDTSGLSSVNIVSSRFHAWNCSLSAVGANAAAVVGVALPRIVAVVVSQTTFGVLGSSTSVSLNNQGTPPWTAAVIAGVAVASCESATLRDNNQTVSWSNATSSADAGNYGASAVGGVAIALVGNGGASFSNTVQYALRGFISSRSASALSVASAASGITVGSSNADVVMNGCTQLVVNCNATSGSRSGNGASTVGGFALGTTGSSASLTNTTQYILKSSATSAGNYDGGSGNGACSVGGVAVGQSRLGTAVANSTQWALMSRLSCSTVGFYSASAVGGVAGARINGFANVLNSTQCVFGSTAQSSNAGSSSAASVGGIAVENAATVMISDTIQYVANSTATCSSWGWSPATVGGVAVLHSNDVRIIRSTQSVVCSVATSTSTSDGIGYAVSSVGGVTVAESAQVVVVANCTLIVTWSTVTARSSSSSSSDSSSVGGIAIGHSPFASVANSAHYVTWSNASSSASTGNGASTVGGIAIANSNTADLSSTLAYVSQSQASASSRCWSVQCLSASSVGGVAVSTGTTLTTALQSILSATNAGACATGSTYVARCGGVVSSTNCCLNTSQPEVVLTWKSIAIQLFFVDEGTVESLGRGITRTKTLLRYSTVSPSPSRQTISVSRSSSTSTATCAAEVKRVRLLRSLTPVMERHARRSPTAISISSRFWIASHSRSVHHHATTPPTPPRRRLDRIYALNSETTQAVGGLSTVAASLSSPEFSNKFTVLLRSMVVASCSDLDTFPSPPAGSLVPPVFEPSPEPTGLASGMLVSTMTLTVVSLSMSVRFAQLVHFMPRRATTDTRTHNK